MIHTSCTVLLTELLVSDTFRNKALKVSCSLILRILFLTLKVLKGDFFSNQSLDKKEKKKAL